MSVVNQSGRGGEQLALQYDTNLKPMSVPDLYHYLHKISYHYCTLYPNVNNLLSHITQLRCSILLFDNDLNIATSLQKIMSEDLFCCVCFLSPGNNDGSGTNPIGHFVFMIKVYDFIFWFDSLKLNKGLLENHFHLPSVLIDMLCPLNNHELSDRVWNTCGYWVLFAYQLFIQHLSSHMVDWIEVIQAPPPPAVSLIRHLYESLRHDIVIQLTQYSYSLLDKPKLSYYMIQDLRKKHFLSA
jgi:hypothetical protein